METTKLPLKRPDDAVAKCKVDLYIERDSTCPEGKFYLLKGVELPIGAALIYEGVKFSTNERQFGLYIK